jgi:hypothetical protein
VSCKFCSFSLLVNLLEDLVFRSRGELQRKTLCFERQRGERNGDRDEVGRWRRGGEHQVDLCCTLGCDFLCPTGVLESLLPPVIYLAYCYARH